jgi:hypothetical protein
MVDVRTPTPRRTVGLLVSLALVAACADRPQWQVVDPAALTATQTAQLGRAKAACEALGTRLKERLTSAIGAGGPVSAIDVCRVAAAEITAQVAAEQGVRIGRTSHRLRNPGNAAPDWAAAQVAKAEAGLSLRAGPEGVLGALLPIPTAAVCVTCHGPKASLAKPVLELLARHYPADQAVGFTVDQLRGWFWVEVR